MPKENRSIQMVDLRRQYERIKPEIDEAIARVLASSHFILGREVEDFESAVSRYLGVKHAIGCASGTDALQIALRAVGITSGDEVITTPFTFVATAEAIEFVGAVPVYVDIDAKTYNIDPSKIEAAVTERTKAIIPVHLYGQAADLGPILEIAKRHGLTVIEDAAQAFGGEYKGRKVGTSGTVSCFSFFPSKNLGAYGDGGMVVANDDVLAERVRMIARHGSRKKYHHEILGMNSRLDSVQAAILNAKLKYVDQWNRLRQTFAQRYSSKLKAARVITPYRMPDCKHIYHQYAIRVPGSEGKSRDELGAYLNSKGIPTAIHYPVPLHLQPASRYLGKKEGDFPVAERVAREILSLPMHTELDDEQIDFISGAIETYMGEKSMSNRPTVLLNPSDLR